MLERAGLSMRTPNEVDAGDRFFDAASQSPLASHNGAPPQLTAYSISQIVPASARLLASAGETDAKLFPSSDKL
jgi:hypothetical protein